ncbi:MAG: DMT family transporter [Alphaproteobacteria bacterium]
MRRWSAVIVGFVGALVIIRPGLGVAHWAVVLPLVTALCLSLYQITTRLLSTIDPPRTTFLYAGLVGALVMTAAVPFVWRPPSAAAWGLMACAGLLGGVGHYCLIKAYQRTAASVLAPFTFSTMLWVTLLGFIVFGDFPDGPTIAGALIIVASGAYVFYRESVVRRRARPADATPP